MRSRGSTNATDWTPASGLPRAESTPRSAPFASTGPPDCPGFTPAASSIVPADIIRLTCPTTTAGAVAVDRVSTTALERAVGAARTPDERAIVIASAWCRIEELRAMGRARDVALEVWAQRQSAEILGAHPHLRVNYPALGLLTTSATAH